MNRSASWASNGSICSIGPAKHDPRSAVVAIAALPPLHPPHPPSCGDSRSAADALRTRFVAADVLLGGSACAVVPESSASASSARRQPARGEAVPRGTDRRRLSDWCHSNPWVAMRTIGVDAVRCPMGDGTYIRPGVGPTPTPRRTPCRSLTFSLADHGRSPRRSGRPYLLMNRTPLTSTTKSTTRTPQGVVGLISKPASALAATTRARPDLPPSEPPRTIPAKPAACPGSSPPLLALPAAPRPLRRTSTASVGPRSSSLFMVVRERAPLACPVARDRDRSATRLWEGYPVGA